MYDAVVCCCASMSLVLDASSAEEHGAHAEGKVVWCKRKALLIPTAKFASRERLQSLNHIN